jgi:hypothetical protein
VLVGRIEDAELHGTTTTNGRRRCHRRSQASAAQEWIAYVASGFALPSCGVVQPVRFDTSQLAGRAPQPCRPALRACFSRCAHGECFMIQTTTTVRMLLLFFVHIVGLKLVEALSTGGWVDSAGARLLPWLWLGDLGLTFVAGTVYLRIADRWSRSKLVRVLFLTTAAGYLTCALGLLSGCGRGFWYGAAYVCSAQQLALLPMSLWTLATDLHAPERQAAVFPRIAAGESLGELLGYGAAAGVAEVWGVTVRVDAILLGAACGSCLVGAALSPRSAVAPSPRRGAGPEAPSERETATRRTGRLRDTFGVLQTERPVRQLALVVACAWVAMTVLMFHLNAQLEAHTMNQPARFRTLYAGYNVGATLAILAAQAWAGGVLRRIPIQSAFVLLPLALVLECAALGSCHALWLTLLLVALMHVIYDAWDSPARHAWLGRLDPTRRGRLTAILDNQAYVLGSATGALVLGILCWRHASAAEQAIVYIGFGAVTALLALWAALRMNWRGERTGSLPSNR